MSVLTALLLGFVQGLTEFLPVSSSGHLSILQNIFKLDYSSDKHLLFDVMLHLGTLAAVLMFYWKDIRAMATDGMAFLTGKDSGQDDMGRLKPSVRTLLMIIVGTVPLVAMLPFHSRVEKLYYNTPFIGFALIITGCLLFVSGRLIEGRKNAKTVTLTDAFVIGISQMIATIPGLSRSGTTITVGLTRGLRREYAVKFSFLLSIPAVLGSVVVTLVDSIQAGIDWKNIPVYFLGMVVSALVGYFSLQFLRRLVMSDNFQRFAVYCWGAGFVAIIAAFIVK